MTDIPLLCSECGSPAVQNKEISPWRFLCSACTWKSETDPREGRAATCGCCQGTGHWHKHKMPCKCHLIEKHMRDAFVRRRVIYLPVLGRLRLFRETLEDLAARLTPKQLEAGAMQHEAFVTEIDLEPDANLSHPFAIGIFQLGHGTRWFLHGWPIGVEEAGGTVVLEE